MRIPLLLAGSLCALALPLAARGAFPPAAPCHYASNAAVLGILRGFHGSDRTFTIGADCRVTVHPQKGSGSTVFLIAVEGSGGKAMSPRRYFVAYLAGLKQHEQSQADSRLAIYRALPGLANAFFFRVVARNNPTNTLSQYVALLRGGRTVVVSDTGYGGYGFELNSPLGFLPLTLLSRIAAQVR
jgi:hypothetical protein